MHLTANLPRNLAVKKFANRLRFDTIMVMSLWPRVFGPPCIQKLRRGRSLRAAVLQRMSIRDPCI